MDSHGTNPIAPFETKEVLFLIPARLTRAYFADLCDECETRIYKRFGEDWRPIRRGVPREDGEFHSTAVIDVLNREFRQSNSIKLLVVAPIASKKLAEAVAQVASERKIQVIALSLPFQHRQPFYKHRVPVPPCVVCDSTRGAIELAEAAAKDLRVARPDVTSPSVVLIRGAEHRVDSSHRLKSFEEGLRKTGLTPIIHKTVPCDWQKRLAYQEMESAINNAKAPIDIVFAANDEMALGARAAIRKSEKWGIVNSTLIYGFDAIPAVRNLIRIGDRHLRGSVAQRLPDLAEALCELIARSQRETIDHACEHDRCVKPKLIHNEFKPRTNIQNAEEAWPHRIPPLNKSIWRFDAEEAKRKRISFKTLVKYREPARRKDSTEDDYGALGKDSTGRIYRPDPDDPTHVWYWPDSLD